MVQRPKRLAILGSTGSIGTQTLDVVRGLAGRFRVVGLAAGTNHELLRAQIEEFKPELVGYEGSLKVPHSIECPRLSLEEIACHPDVDTVVIATSGTVAIRATVAAARSGKTIALANKESLVAAGEIVMREARRSGARILPVDSEHSAIFQCLKGERKPPHRIILTASGGPFLKLGKTEIQNATAAQALRHPSWRMGKKVTVDAASLMNKGLEVIEAHWLFNMPFDRITVLVHPQSIVHSMVEFADGSVKAQMGYPDMRLPIQYALTYPERLKNENLPRLDWVSLKSLTFDLPDTERFPCLELAVRAGKAGGTMPSVLAAADDVAVELFLAQRIRFGDIPDVLGRVLAAHRNIFRPSLEDILEAMRWAREKTFELAGGTQ